LEIVTSPDPKTSICHRAPRRLSVRARVSLSIAGFSDHDTRWFSFCFHHQSCPENSQIPAITKAFEIMRPKLDAHNMMDEAK
jgi:hypothetical protein